MNLRGGSTGFHARDRARAHHVISWNAVYGNQPGPCDFLVGFPVFSL